MAIIVNKGELESLRPAADNLTQRATDSQGISNIVREFQVSDNILKGEIWQTEGQKLEQFILALEKSKTSAEKLSQSITNAINDLITVWDSRFGDSIDDQYRDEIQRELNETEDRIEELRAAISEMIDGSEEKASAEAALAEAINLANELRDLLLAIDNFLAVYQSVSGVIDQLVSSLDSDFGNFVKQITSTFPWSFNH